MSDAINTPAQDEDDVPVTQTSKATAAAIKASGASVAEVLEQLKTKADTLGVAYSSKIGVDALRERINAHLAEEVKDVADTKNMSSQERENALRVELYNREMKLVRCRITNLNPSKTDLEGEIFCVANKYIGDVKKFIPYGEVTDEGYQLPFVLYTELKARKFTQIKTRMVQGQIVVDQRDVSEFAIEVLEQLNPRELAKLANQQAAAAGSAAGAE